ncbi:MAG: GyrI-like domain-containing protein [Candidatus Ranarchaeia archaeon]|jgi:hypothetical protein
MEKIDFKKTLKEFYKPPTKPVIVDVPKMQFLMIDGKGDPNTAQEYKDAIQTLYPVAYNLKFTLKHASIIDYTVPPLEGLWWAEDMNTFTTLDTKDHWLWTAMIMQPKEVTHTYLEQIKEKLRKKDPPPSLEKLRIESYHEGPSVQVFYVGPYSDEGPTIQNMHQHAFDQGYKLDGKHHEIYLNDARRTAPEKLKTVIRQPITKA